MKRAAPIQWNLEDSNEEDLFTTESGSSSEDDTLSMECSQDITEREIISYGFNPVYCHPLGLLLVSAPCYFKAFELQLTYARIQLDTYSYKALSRGSFARHTLPPNLVSNPRWISRVQLNSWCEMMGGIREILSLICLNLIQTIQTHKWVHVEAYLHPFFVLSWLTPTHFGFLQNTNPHAPFHLSRFHALISKYEYNQMVWRTPIKNSL